MIFCQYQTKFDKLSFLRMHVLADFAADFDHDYNHSLPPASIDEPRYAAICSGRGYKGSSRRNFLQNKFFVV